MKHPVQIKALEYLDELENEEKLAWVRSVIQRRANYMDLVKELDAGKSIKSLGYYIPKDRKVLIPLK